MELAIPTSPEFGDFKFGSTCSTPYISAPSTPKRFGEFYHSAPTSPARASDIYHGFNDLSSSAIPFDWEEKPRRHKSKNDDDDDEEEEAFFDDDFAFDFSGQNERTSLSAEELFDGGVIRPLKPPPRLQLGDESSTRNTSVSSPRSPIAQGKKMIRDAFSPRQKKNIDPFAGAIEQTRKGSDKSQNRGREREPIPMSSRSGRRGARSHSPYRVPEFTWEEEQKHQQENMKSESSISKQASSSSSTSSSSSSSLKSSKKWRLRDWLLFRSASEGRASDKDPLRKYTVLPKKHQESTETIGSPARSSPRRKGPVVSPHELHYKTNRAVSEDMKKKTFLPYKQGLLGVARGFGYFGSG
ncbi:uncharacterized protein LOC122662305 [Telopea speciosissima]|uniref:uncharacterized protein LOC122662305 n=1 Tax=Telopea speciosissima TaxID=54955 RepID=UPI001CC35BF5|nr:uncharacterized protein LOC122662305 [Telopea speciosissima]